MLQQSGVPAADKDLKVRTQVHEKRWRTVANCVDDVKRLKKTLIWGWDKDKFRDKEKKLSVAAELVDEAVNSSLFWFCLDALEHLHFIVQEMLDRAQGCPCHSAFVTADTPRHIEDRWMKCPLRSCRLPELCAGDLFEVMHSVVKLQGVSLALNAPSDVAPHERDLVLGDYIRAACHLICTM